MKQSILIKGNGDINATVVTLLIVTAVVFSMAFALFASGYTNAQLTQGNDGIAYKDVDYDYHTIVVTDGGITYDNRNVDLSEYDSLSSFPILFSDSKMYVYYDTADKTVYVLSESDSPVKYSVADGKTVTVSIELDVANVSSSASSDSITISKVAQFISTNGDYRLSSTPYVSNESIIRYVGISELGAEDGLPSDVAVSLAFEGTIDSLHPVILNVETASADTVKFTKDKTTISNVDVGLTEINSDLVRIDSMSVQYQMTGSDDVTYTASASVCWFLVSAKAVYDNPDFIGGIPAIIVSSIPLIVALVTVFIMYRAYNQMCD